MLKEAGRTANVCQPGSTKRAEEAGLDEKEI